MKAPKKFSPLTVKPTKKFYKERMYDTVSWTEYRLKFLSANPRCYACGTSARVVDHIVAHKEDEVKFWAVTNFIPLCKKCHDTITAYFDRHSPPKTEAKMIWISNKREETETTLKVKVVPR